MTKENSTGFLASQKAALPLLPEMVSESGGWALYPGKELVNVKERPKCSPPLYGRAASLLFLESQVLRDGRSLRDHRVESFSFIDEDSNTSSAELK